MVNGIAGVGTLIKHEEQPALLPRARQTRTILLSLVCAAILAGILVAGLWPFHSPANRITWLNGNGLWFQGRGTALSAGAFKPQAGLKDGPCSVEIWLIPEISWDRSTILAFYAANHAIPFSVHQSNRDLLIERQPRSAISRRGAAKLYVRRVFRADKPVDVGITSDGHETVVYINGALAAESQTFEFTRSDLAGEMVVANSPVVDDTWSGILTGLAISNRLLTQPLALEHYRSWAEGGRPAVVGEQPVAFYLFDQSAGRTIRNQAGVGPSLYLPSHYTVFDEILLERPWDEYAPGLKYWKDVAINIAGFVPLGFFFCAYLSLIWRRRRATLLTIIIGAAVSITIEVLQSYLPTRDSGMTDLFTNTLGTAVGAGLFWGTKVVLERSLGRSRHRQGREIAAWLTQS